jgi:AraC-like DNA-binding protein
MRITMNQQESTRTVIDARIHAGWTVKEIMDTFEIARKMHKRRSDYKGTALAEDLRELVTKDPGRSMRSMAQEMNVSRTTVRKMVSEDLRYKSYAMRRGQFMSEATKIRRLEKAKKLLARIKHPSSPILSSSSQTTKTSRRTRK